MLTVVVATIISRHLMKGESIYTLKLSRRGVRLKLGKDIDLMDSVLVRDVMQTTHTTLNMNVEVISLAELFIKPPNMLLLY